MLKYISYFWLYCYIPTHKYNNIVIQQCFIPCSCRKTCSNNSISALFRATKQISQFWVSITYKTVLSGTNPEEEDKLQPNSDPETITHPVQTGWRLHEYNYFSEQQSRQLWFSAAARGGVFRQKGHVVCQLIPRMRTWTDLYCAHSRSSRYPHSLLFDVMVSCHDIFSVLLVGGLE